MAADPRRARAESDAVALLYSQHYDRVYGYCLYKLGSREEAEDAAQTAFLYALRGLRRGVVPVVELNWLLTIAKNVCLAGYRTRGRRRRLEVLSDPQVLADAASVDDETDVSVLRLEEALARIPAQQRRAILLREWRGLSYREIADELGLTLAAVETLIFRARRSLAELLGEESKRSRRRLAGILDLGGLAGAAKSLLGGASAAKVAAGVAVVAAALVAGPAVAPPDEPRQVVPSAPPPAAEPAVRPDPPAARPLPAGKADERKSASRAERSDRWGGGEAKAKPGPGGAPRPSQPEAPPIAPATGPAEVVDTTTGTVGGVVGGAVETVEGVVENASDTVGGVVGTASETVDGAVGRVSGTVDAVADETGLPLPLPEVGGLTDDVTGEVGGIVEGLPEVPSVSSPERGN